MSLFSFFKKDPPQPVVTPRGPREFRLGKDEPPPEPKKDPYEALFMPGSTSFLFVKPATLKLVWVPDLFFKQGLDLSGAHVERLKNNALVSEVHAKTHDSEYWRKRSEDALRQIPAQAGLRAQEELTINQALTGEEGMDGLWLILTYNG